MLYNIMDLKVFHCCNIFHIYIYINKHEGFVVETKQTSLESQDVFLSFQNAISKNIHI